MAESLVITIAHRLKTVFGKSIFARVSFRMPISSNRFSDYDRILVLGDGNVLEFDTPAALLAKEGGAFREMCMRSADWDELRQTARDQMHSES